MDVIYIIIFLWYRVFRLFVNDSYGFSICYCSGKLGDGLVKLIIYDFWLFVINIWMIKMVMICIFVCVGIRKLSIYIRFDVVWNYFWICLFYFWNDNGIVFGL